jgi:hypothetical protein
MAGIEVLSHWGLEPFVSAARGRFEEIDCDGYGFVLAYFRDGTLQGSWASIWLSVDGASREALGGWGESRYWGVRECGRCAG